MVQIKPDLTISLSAFTNKTRLEIIRHLSQTNNSVAFTKLLKKLGLDSKNSSNLANHLKKLVEWNLVSKDNSFYTLTKLGKQLYDQIDGIEKIIEEHNRDIMVRTSDFCFEPFDEAKIAQNLIREADFTQDEAFLLARTAKRKILNANITYLTAPLIREYMNFILLESGKEEARHKLTRLGLPPYDVKQLLDQGHFENSAKLYSELGKNIMEQFLLLNLLPQRYADFYLSGKIFFLHPESWALNPLEVIISGENFAQIIIKTCQNHKNSSDSPENTIAYQYFPLAMKNWMEELKNFFSGGVVITDFSKMVHELRIYFNQKAENILHLIFEMTPAVKVQVSHDKRDIHSRTWELWFELDLNNLEVYREEIELIISHYHKDTVALKDGELNSEILTKPNMAINYTGEHRSILIEAKQYRDLPKLHKQLLDIGLVHNAIFISPTHPKQPKVAKRILTPHLNPVAFRDGEQSVLVLEKIYVNLPKIIQISEEMMDSCNPDPDSDEITDTSETPNQEKFFGNPYTMGVPCN